MNASIREPDEYAGELPLCWRRFDPPEPKQPESAEPRITGPTARGFLNALLQASSV